jgi:hypothetical protein
MVAPAPIQPTTATDAIPGTNANLLGSFRWLSNIM